MLLAAPHRRAFAALLGPALAVGTLAAAIAPSYHAAMAVRPGTWGTAEEVPGTAVLNQDGQAQVASLSCSSSGNCTAGGSYINASAQRVPFVAAETNGVWGAAKRIPGTAPLEVGSNAKIESVSCVSAGNCAAAGQYLKAVNDTQVFVASETNGRWGSAEEVPGIAALNAGGYALIASVSCASAGNCSAGGWYEPGFEVPQAFVVDETNGIWGTAEQVPGTAVLAIDGNADVASVSCASAENCSAVGNYTNRAGNQVFVVDEKNGTWGAAKEAPGTAILNRGGQAQIFSVSCASPGNCGAGGLYLDSSRHSQAFVVSETNGRWGAANEVPTTALNGGKGAAIYSVSCASAGNCSVGGLYAKGSSREQALVVDETNGNWGAAENAPGAIALNQGGIAEIASVSCASAGNCSAGGSYTDASGKAQVFVLDEANGVWGSAEEVPGTAALNTGGNAALNSLSCAPAGSCDAGGYFENSAGMQAFVVNQVISRTPPAPSAARSPQTARPKRQLAFVVIRSASGRLVRNSSRRS
jgi:hypothetical protein